MTAADITESMPRERQSWRTPRHIGHDEARESIGRLIASHFGKADQEHARTSIPANPDRDDDLIAHSYVEQQRERDAQRLDALAEVEDLLSPLPDKRPAPGDLVKVLSIVRAELAKVEG